MAPTSSSTSGDEAGGDVVGLDSTDGSKRLSSPAARPDRIRNLDLPTRIAASSPRSLGHEDRRAASPKRSSLPRSLQRGVPAGEPYRGRGALRPGSRMIGQSLVAGRKGGLRRKLEIVAEAAAAADSETPRRRRVVGTPAKSGGTRDGCKRRSWPLKVRAGADVGPRRETAVWYGPWAAAAPAEVDAGELGDMNPGKTWGGSKIFVLVEPTERATSPATPGRAPSRRRVKLDRRPRNAGPSREWEGWTCQRRRCLRAARVSRSARGAPTRRGRRTRAPARARRTGRGRRRRGGRATGRSCRG